MIKTKIFWQAGISVALSILVMLLICDSASAARNKCKRLRRARILAIKNTGEYLVRRKETKRFRNKKKAEKNGFNTFAACNKGSSIALKKILPASRCRLTFGIIDDWQYLTAKELKVFKNRKRAERKGFVPYTDCPSGNPTPTSTPDPNITLTPTPTPDPNATATPLPTQTPTPAPGPDTTKEDGISFDGIYTSSTVKLKNGNYVSYLAKNTTSFANTTIEYASSVDGVNWSALATIQGITPDSDQTFTHPSILELQNGEFVLAYQITDHIGSAGIDFNILMRAESADGISFANNPDNNMLNSGSFLREPELFQIDENSYRVYFNGSGIESALSNDGGLTWTREGEVTINGISDSYVPYPGGPDIVKLENGTLRMFIHGTPDVNATQTKLYSATSSDGRVFQIEAGPLLEPEQGHSHANPDVFEADDQHYRVFFTDRYEDNGQKWRLLSALIDK